MRRALHKNRRDREAGVALLIAIFALLLISVIAIALVVSAGTNSALQNNYRTLTGSYYSGLAGLEEARGRLLWKNADYINATNSYPTLLNAQGLPTWGLTQVLYIDNPAVGEVVDPTSADPAQYPDTEYQNEFGFSLSGTVVTQITSKSPDPTASLPADQWKWVRITPVTEQSLGLDVNVDGVIDAATPLYYDPANVDASNKPSPGLVVSPTPPATAVQALQITSYSVLPGGSRRLLQYVVAPLVISPSATGNIFPAALTLAGALDGTLATFQHPPGPSPSPPPPPPPSSLYQITGVDSCPTPIPQGAVAAIGTTNAGDHAAVLAELSPSPPSPFIDRQYSGAPMGTPPGPVGPTKPSVAYLSPPGQIRQSWLNPVTLDAVVQDITKSADVVINGPATGTNISNQASMMVDNSARPMTVVVNGDLTLAGWQHWGYGLLLVTGTLNYDPDAGWNGIVLVIGQGIFSSSKNGIRGIVGSVLVAKTRDDEGNLLATPTLGAPFFGTHSSFGSSPGPGIIYSSCAGQSPLGPSAQGPPAQGPLTYKVLSFREIAVP